MTRSVQQLEMDRVAEPLLDPKAQQSAGMKTILVHIQNDESLDSRLETALSLARACGAHLDCLHVTPIEAYVAFDNFGGVFVMNDVIKALDDEEDRVRARVEEKLRGIDVTWSYDQVTGNAANVLVSQAALADLLVTGRGEHSGASRPAMSVLGDLLHRVRTPMFIAGDEDRPVNPTGVAVIAWDGSYEAANTVRAAAGLLKLASEVRVLQIEEDKDRPFPGTRLLSYLSRHGIHAELRVERMGGDRQTVAAAIMGHACAVDGAYLVMGGFNHNRIGQYLFGGVTRTFLTSASLPILISR